MWGKRTPQARGDLAGREGAKGMEESVSGCFQGCVLMVKDQRAMDTLAGTLPGNTTLSHHKTPVSHRQLWVGLIWAWIQKHWREQQTHSFTTRLEPDRKRGDIKREWLISRCDVIGTMLFQRGNIYE
jgi:hypothetical protein